MSLAANIADIAFANAYPVDKIVKVIQGSVSIASLSTIGGLGTPYVHSVTHGFDRPVFTQLISSSDNTTFIDGGHKDICYSTSSQIKILTNQPAGTLYYKVICSWIDNFGSATFVTPSLNWQKDITFDSRTNYQKIFSQAQINMTPGANTTISHNLGYSPNVKVYFEAFTGEVWPANWGGTGNAFLYDFVNQTELHFVSKTNDLYIETFGGTGSRKVWYRIYADGN